MKQLRVGQSRRAAGLAVGVPGSVLVPGQRWLPFSEASGEPSAKPCLAPCKASVDPSQRKQGREFVTRPGVRSWWWHHLFSRGAWQSRSLTRCLVPGTVWWARGPHGGGLKLEAWLQFYREETGPGK